MPEKCELCGLTEEQGCDCPLATREIVKIKRKLKDALGAIEGWRSVTATLEVENAKLRRQVEVPNLWLCEACGLQLNEQSFDPCTGEVGQAAVQEIPVCLNDDEHGPMRRQTWQENASAHADACDELASANAKMSEEPVNLRLLAAAAFLYIAERREGWEEGPSWTEAIDRIHDELSNAIGDVGIGEVTTWLERHDVEIRRTTPIDFAEMIRAAYAPPGQRGSK